MVVIQHCSARTGHRYTPCFAWNISYHKLIYNAGRHLFLLPSIFVLQFYWTQAFSKLICCLWSLVRDLNSCMAKSLWPQTCTFTATWRNVSLIVDQYTHFGFLALNGSMEGLRYSYCPNFWLDSLFGMWNFQVNFKKTFCHFVFPKKVMTYLKFLSWIMPPNYLTVPDAWIWGTFSWVTSHFLVFPALSNILHWIQMSWGYFLNATRKKKFNFP